jgi:hypothetical protein
LKAAVAKASPTASPATAATQTQPFWTRMKERGHYWLLLAQLNPIPVAVGAGLLIFLIGLLLVQRRRAKATRRVKPSPAVTKKPTTDSVAAVPVSPVAETSPQPEVATPMAAATVVAPLAAQQIANDAPAPAPAPASVPVPVASIGAPVDDRRRERVNQVAAEARQLFEGANYDETIIGSEDRDSLAVSARGIERMSSTRCGSGSWSAPRATPTRRRHCCDSTFFPGSEADSPT